MFKTNILRSSVLTLRNLFNSRDSTENRLVYKPEKQETNQIKESCERVLLKNIVPFWFPDVIDLQEGGYRLNHDFRGTWKGPSNKYFVTQARTCWFFSRLSRSEYGTSEHLDAAHHGYAFLRDHMWDRKNGGFYWEVETSGLRIIKPDKHLYAQAFGLYALLEYAKASGDTTVNTLAENLFCLLEDHAHDPKHGGYKECFYRDWSRLPEDHIDYLNVAAPNKSMNTHLHLLEAMTQYYLVTGESLARERLNELVIVLSNTLVNKNFSVCTDNNQHDWKPLRGRHNDRVSYGHQLENIWMLMEACRGLGFSNDPLLELYRALFGYALKYGFDRSAGGFYETGPINGPADQRDKIWWVQAECLVSALAMYGLTREKAYFDCFLRTLDWIMKYQIDWEGGDWYSRVSETKKPSGDKAGAWKSPYHNGRAMLQCLELLHAIDPSASDPALDQ